MHDAVAIQNNPAPDYIQQTQQQKDANLFQANLEILERFSSQDFLSDKLEPIIEQCAKYASSSLSTEILIERYRKIAYSIVSNSSIWYAPELMDTLFYKLEYTNSYSLGDR